MNSASSNTDANSPLPSSSASQQVPSSPGPSRQAHIHFPTEPASPPPRSPTSPGFSGAGLRSLGTSSRNDLLRAGSSTSPDIDSSERRYVLSDALRPLGAYSRTQYLADATRTRTAGKRAVSHSLHSSDRSNNRGTSSLGSSPLSIGMLLPPEEDSANQEDDPNILADLHKALQYKPHVEQHLKEVKSLTEIPPSSPPLAIGPSSHASPMTTATKGQFPFSQPNTPIGDEFIDFSPAVGKSSLHPVPKSSDEGATLDWSGSANEEEKHESIWSMSLPRRSSKDKNPPLSRKALVEKQDVQYSEKLVRIKAKANESTKRKAEITRDQLQRRYAAFNAAYISKGSHLSPTDVARWYDNQGAAVKAQITESDSMPWLRHLQSKRGYGQQERRLPSPWNLSAMIIDHYMRSHSDAPFFIPPTSGEDDLSDVGSSVSVGRGRRVSKPTSSGSYEAPMALKSDDAISFEPMVQPQRNSAGTDSRNSVDTQLKRWRQSLLNRGEPDLSSESSMSRRRTESSERRNAEAMQTSPASSRNPFHSIGMTKLSHASPMHSDDGQSSAADSVGGRRNDGQDSDSKAKNKSTHERKRSRFPLSLDLKSAHHSQADLKNVLPPLSIADLRTDATQPNKRQGLPVSNEKAAVGSVDNFEEVPSSNNQSYLGSPLVLSPARKIDEQKSQTLSLPPVFQATRTRRGRSDTQTEAQRHVLQVEYNRKQELLDALLARNQRMKGLLQIASRSIIDYDETQSAMAYKLGLEYSQLPPEVLESLKHDPSAITGHLRYLKGWRAVEDIHRRRERQRDILQTFVTSLPETVTPLSLPKEGIFENAVAELTDLVERLSIQRTTVISHVQQTQELLNKVKEMRDDLKPEFDEVSKLTSVNYPELVRLESLLDEFVNETNHLWRLAEASLSFLLTSVAPFMKTFGRPVWNELHDFLVIPIYRNGFSGEDHWYPVTFPRRSFAHWLRLLLFGLCIPLILVQGNRAFVALLTHGYVIRIPSFIPTLLVYIIFSGAMCVFAFSLLGLLIAMLCELFIILWWTSWFLHIVQ